MRGAELDQAIEALRAAQSRVDRLFKSTENTSQAELAAVCATLGIDEDSDIKTIIQTIVELQRRVVTR